MARLIKKQPDTQPEALPNTLRIADLTSRHKAEQIVAYHVEGLTLVADCFIMCSANSEPHMKALYNAVREGMKEAGTYPIHTEGTPQDGWILMDYGSIILHIFRHEAREFYDLDALWADAPRIDLGVDED